MLRVARGVTARAPTTTISAKAGKKLAQRDHIGIAAIAEPFSKIYELFAKLAEVGDRPAERGEAQTEEDEEDFRPRAMAGR